MEEVEGEGDGVRVGEGEMLLALGKHILETSFGKAGMERDLALSMWNLPLLQRVCVCRRLSPLYFRSARVGRTFKFLLLLLLVLLLLSPPVVVLPGECL